MLNSPMKVLATLSVLFSSLATCASVAGQRVLVVDEVGSQEKYSQFFNDLKDRGYDLVFESPKSTSLSLFQRGERIYDHAILLPPSSKAYGPNLTPQTLVKFINSSGNILLLINPSSVPETTRDFAREMDIFLPPKDYAITDHYIFDRSSARENHDTLIVRSPQGSPDQKSYFSTTFPVIWKGTGFTIGNSPLVNPILKGARGSYVYDTKEDAVYTDDPWAVGAQINLVAAVQARNNARLTVVGSDVVFTDEFFDKEVTAADGYGLRSGNREFARKLVSWTFQETGVLRVDKIEHGRVGFSERNEGIYRVKNDLEYTVTLSEHTPVGWKPYVAPPEDRVQLEFTMLDPHYRLNLNQTEPGVYHASFKAPDRHGIFSFRLNYKRPFVSYIDEKQTITLRHFAHDEYTRSWAISGAWVWLAGIVVTIAGWGLFVVGWLWCEETSGVKKKGKKLL
ncbi:Dolichyl-diphosphooligosaccharide-protein glycosyltransferase 48kDa subunit [Ascobolus immersus RN42]|uniref:Dolichyl-diphosphooligosaccharide--protein glycosyltransferase subunit WBP1 n=1 Tax=Ascobolus immersus RN42 TaxID=1160509 RepID=A0A3N4I7L5_ASCIM|nr:Dolichyl-diphosphooligosaccharide-protein glycosyltransferase 48kDa subunit [Ascobolus immersus RN42]